MAMTKRERETVDGHDQKRERERQSMAMTKRERKTVDSHDQERESRWSWREKANPTTKRERERQSMAMTKREQMVMSKRGNKGNY